MSQPAVYAIANQKGGVGKTTTTLNVAAALAESGQAVLVVDCDPQASATVAVGRGDDEHVTLVDVYEGDAPLSAAAIATDWGFDLVASEIALAKRESNRQLGDEHRLREALADPGLRAYDAILLDCPPSLGVMTIAALTAAQRVVIVTEAGRFALRGMGDLLDTVDVVRRYYNAALEVAGVIVNLVDHTNVTKQRLAEINEFFDEHGQVWEPVIPRGVAAKEATDQGIPLGQLKAHRAEEYRELYQQLAERLIREGARA